MNTLQKLKNAQDIADFAELLNTTQRHLNYILSRYSRSPRRITPKSDQKHPLYHEFTIPKKSGGTRLIKAPSPALKKLQRRLSDLLYTCLAEIDAQRDAKPVSFAFHKKLQIADNAHTHRAKSYVLNLDLRDFFPSFTYPRIRGFFIASRDFQLNKTVAGLLTSLACDETGLPQGAPSSPIISELMGRILDIRLLRLARQYSVRYSRYADDITFSTYKKDFPTALAYQNEDNATEWFLGTALTETISRAGFTINDKKTRMQQRHVRQMVNGLVVNKKVNIKEEYYKNTRAMCHSLFKTGRFTINGSDATLNMLEGRLGYIYSIKKFSRQEPHQNNPEPAIAPLYRKFLFYKYFLSSPKALIITENNEHHIYIKEAIHHIKKSHSFFIEKNDPDKLRLHFFKYTKIFRELFKKNTSSNYLKSILVHYKLFTEYPKSPNYIAHKPCINPVIIVINNNDSLQKITPLIEKLFHKTISITSWKPFYHLTSNLYLVKMPEGHPVTHNPKTSFENFIPTSWRKKLIKKTSFSTAGNKGVDVYIRKKIPSESGNHAPLSPIDVSFLESLLLRIKDVMDHHYNNRRSQP